MRLQPPEAKPVPAPPEQLLQAASTGFGLIDAAGRLVWCNSALARNSEKQACSPQTVVEDFLAAAGESAATTIDGSALRLVEIPAAASDERQEDRPLDSLTGVLNREAFLDELDRAFFAGQQKPFALLFADLDDFKQINDRHGHLAGDDCLRVVGGRLSSVLRSGDTVGRFGGDEFLVLLRGVAYAPMLKPIERRLRGALLEPIDGPEGPLRIGVSLGVAYSRDGHPTALEMIAAADRDMYKNKRSGAPPSA